MMKTSLKWVAILLLSITLILQVPISSVLAATTVQPTLAGVPVVTDYYSGDIFNPLHATQASVTLTADNLDIKSKSYVLMDYATGQVLAQGNEHAKVAPASVTKIMSFVLVAQALQSGKIKLTDKVTASADCSSMGGSQIWLKPGEVMTVDELLRAACIGSANDATVALSEYVAGSETAFVNLMNEEAAKLGMKDTHFMNCAGLDTSGHETSAYDVALMSRELLKYPAITKYTSTWMDELRGGQTELVNTNKLVRFYPGCIGLKTGTTSQAGFCLSAAASRNNMTLIAVVMGAANNDDRFGGARKLLDYGFANWSSVPIDTSKFELPTVKVNGGMEQEVALIAKPLANLLVPKGKEKDIKPKFTIAKELYAPVTTTTQVGTVELLLNNKVIAKTNIYPVKTVEKMTFSKAISRLLNGLFS